MRNMLSAAHLWSCRLVIISLVLWTLLTGPTSALVLNGTHTQRSADAFYFARQLHAMQDGMTLNVTVPGGKPVPDMPSVSVTTITRVTLPPAQPSNGATATELQTTLRTLLREAHLPGDGNVTCTMQGWIVMISLNITRNRSSLKNNTAVLGAEPLPEACNPTSLNHLESDLDCCPTGRSPNITVACEGEPNSSDWDTCDATPGRLNLAITLPDTCDLATVAGLLVNVTETYALNHTETVCQMAMTDLWVAFDVRTAYSFAVVSTDDHRADQLCISVAAQTPDALQGLVKNAMITPDASSMMNAAVPSLVGGTDCVVRPASGGSGSPGSSSSINVGAIIAGCIAGAAVVSIMVVGYTVYRKRSAEPSDGPAEKVHATGVPYTMGPDGPKQCLAPYPLSDGPDSSISIQPWKQQVEDRDAAAQNLNQQYKAIQMAAILNGTAPADPPAKYSAAAARKARLKAARAAEQNTAAGIGHFSSASSSMHSWASTNTASSGISTGPGSIAAWPSMVGQAPALTLPNSVQHGAGYAGFMHGEAAPPGSQLAAAQAAAAAVAATVAAAAQAAAASAPAARLPDPIKRTQIITTAGPATMLQPEQRGPRAAPAASTASPQQHVLDLGGPVPPRGSNDQRQGQGQGAGLGSSAAVGAVGASASGTSYGTATAPTDGGGLRPPRSSEGSISQGSGLTQRMDGSVPALVAHDSPGWSHGGYGQSQSVSSQGGQRQSTGSQGLGSSVSHVAAPNQSMTGSQGVSGSRSLTFDQRHSVSGGSQGFNRSVVGQVPLLAMVGAPGSQETAWVWGTNTVAPGSSPVAVLSGGSQAGLGPGAHQGHTASGGSQRPGSGGSQGTTPLGPYASAPGSPLPDLAACRHDFPTIPEAEFSAQPAPYSTAHFLPSGPYGAPASLPYTPSPGTSMASHLPPAGSPYLQQYEHQAPRGVSLGGQMGHAGLPASVHQAGLFPLPDFIPDVDPYAPSSPEMDEIFSMLEEPPAALPEAPAAAAGSTDDFVCAPSSPEVDEIMSMLEEHPEWAVAGVNASLPCTVPVDESMRPGNSVEGRLFQTWANEDSHLPAVQLPAYEAQQQTAHQSQGHPQTWKHPAVDANPSIARRQMQQVTGQQFQAVLQQI